MSRPSPLSSHQRTCESISWIVEKRSRLLFISRVMSRYYFDLIDDDIDDDEVVPDEEGMELPGIDAAQLDLRFRWPM
jgi:hypothetical protein